MKVRPAPTARAIEEWVGKMPDSDPPPHVCRRIFDAHQGRCHITGRPIDPVRDLWHVEHKRSLRNGGENRESNLGPALIEPHRIKTARENSRGAKADRIREKLLGLHKSRQPIVGGRRTRWKHRLDGKFGGRGSWERRPGNG